VTGLERVLVAIPTYNESQNIERIIARTLAAVPTANVLVVDDASPDGTGDIADALAAADDRVAVAHRAGKAGLGAAYQAAFEHGLAAGYNVLVEMDADGSHRPEDLPRLLAALQSADLALGSRWVRGGRVVDWSRSRELISRGANLFARLALGMPVRDSTGGFRAYRRTTLEKIDFRAAQSRGYCFQIDLTWRVVRAGLRIREVPITFVERQRGQSKMDSSIMIEAALRITQWGIAHRWRQLTGVLRRIVRLSAT